MKTTTTGNPPRPITKKLAYLGRIVFVVLFILVHTFAIRNMFLLSGDLLLGDHSGENIRPIPQYEFLRIPGTRWTKSSNAAGRLAIDFAQVYFPSKVFNELSKNYKAGEFDPLDRPSRYAPFVHYLCASSYCRLDYGPASLVHLYLQLILFYICFTAAFFLLKIARHLPVGILVASACLFLTPAGLSWFERGQFSLYVALAYLFVLLGVLQRRPFFFLLGGFFAFVKWTSFPTIFVIISTVLLASGSLRRLKENVLLVVPFAAIILLLLAIFPKNSYYFLQGLYQQEAFAHAGGVSLVRLLPVEFVKLMPFALVGLGLLHIRKYRGNLEECLSFFTGAGILMLIYPTLVFDYSVSTLFGFIPFIFYWADRQENKNQATARTAMEYSFFLFLLIASFSPMVVRVFGTEYAMYWIYGLVAAVFLFIPLVPAFQRARVTPGPGVAR